MSAPESGEGAAGGEAHVRLQMLGMHLKAHGFAVEHVNGGLVVRNADAAGCCDGQRVRGDTITCRPYEADGGRYWFFTSWRRPLTEAERVTDAVVMVKGYLASAP